MSQYDVAAEAGGIMKEASQAREIQVGIRNVPAIETRSRRPSRKPRPRENRKEEIIAPRHDRNSNCGEGSNRGSRPGGLALSMPPLAG
jgi:hypothetical protein